MWVKVHIVCSTTPLHQRKEMGLDINPDDYDVRLGKINTDHIVGYYPTDDYKEVLVEYTGGCFQLAMTYTDFDLLINNNKQS